MCTVLLPPGVNPITVKYVSTATLYPWKADLVHEIHWTRGRTPSGQTRGDENSRLLPHPAFVGGSEVIFKLTSQY